MRESSPERVLARYMLEPSRRRKTAAFPPSPQNSENGGGEAAAGKRNIPKDHEFQARALKPLSKALWASTVALGHTLTAYRHLSRLKSATVSPDGLMGGRGYVMKLAEMRQKLYEASEALSTISDTIFDELNAPHWKPKLAQLDENDREDVARFVEESQEVLENPEGDAEDEIEEIEAENDGPKKKKKKDLDGTEEDSSNLPTADESQAESEVHEDAGLGTKTASSKVRPAGMSERAWVHEFYGDPTRSGYVAPVPLDPAEQLVRQIYVKANSSIEVSEMPGGPRVDHLGPGTGQGEYGEFNEPESAPADPWSADGGGISRRDDTGEDYDYPSEWENETAKAAAWKDPSACGRRDRVASAGIPDSSTDDTPTEAWDFGIGYGARGQGAGGYANPSGEGNGKGVWGPQSGLPGTPSQSTGDTTHRVVDEKLNRHAREVLYGELPQDVAGEVARSDYYPGAKDNMVSVGTSQTPTVNDTWAEGGHALLDTHKTFTDIGTDDPRYDFSTHTIREPDGFFGESYAPDGEATR